MRLEETMPALALVPSEIIKKWQEIVDLIAEIIHVPSAVVMRVEPCHSEVFVASDCKPSEAGSLYCETVMKTRQPLLVPDARRDERWKSSPDIKRGMVSYLGVPISWPNGEIFGTICVYDNKSNEYSRLYLRQLLLWRDVLQNDLKTLATWHGQLEQHEAKIRRLFDANIIGIIIWDLEGRILEANDAFLRMGGYDREDLISGRLNRTDLTPPEWRGRDARTDAELKMIGAVQPFEKEYFRKDGSRVPVLIGLAAFSEERDQGVAFVLDLTGRKRVEERLRVQHTVAQVLAEAATIEEATPRILRAMGECLGWDVGALWRVDREAEVLRCVELWHKASIEVPEFERVSREFTFVPGLGLPGRVWSSLEPEYIPDVVPDENFPRAPIAEREGLHAAFGFPILLGGEVLGVVEFFSRKIGQPDQELLNLLATIGSQIGQFIERKRAEEAFRKVQMELAHANRVATMGQLSASITHEVKQPIAAARNNARAALNFMDRNPPDLAEVREALGCIMGDADRAADIIDRIRDHIHKAPPRKECLDINAGIREVIELTRGESVKNGISMQADLADGLPLIEGDRVQLQQVILNLIVNAVEAMSGASDGTRELLVSSRKADPGGVLVGVRDSGPGLAPETLDHIFEAFYTTKPGGLGMGLSICRSIIEAHGGRLWASANLPRGASFQFTLPAIASTAS
jgi:PAS domain S-box-containing protein